MNTIVSDTSAREAASRLSEDQRRCGNLLDAFPCAACGAAGPGICPLPPSATIPARDLINSTQGLGNLLRNEARAMLSATPSSDGERGK